MYASETVILLLSYNNENTSCKSKNYILFIFDDCSSNSTHDICIEYTEKDSRIHLSRNGKKLGVLGNLEHALSSINDIVHKSSFFGPAQMMNTKSFI